MDLTTLVVIVTIILGLIGIIAMLGNIIHLTDKWKRVRDEVQSILETLAWVLVATGCFGAIYFLIIQITEFK